MDHVEVTGTLDPTLAWAHASAQARDALLQALTPEGMDARLADTRALLLGPGAASVITMVQRDPLRLAQIPAEMGTRLGEGASASSPGMLGSAGGMVTDDGRARLVLVVASGNALRGADARRFVDSVQASLTNVRNRLPDVRFELTGGHAIAAATESMIRRDLLISGTASMVFASIAFAFSFRRVRALIAVLPPLVLGTLWTAAIAGTVFGRVSAIAVAFVSVVVGVGVDTGVHVYAALMDARREGLCPSDAARKARSTMARPTLIAALAAAVAFFSLSLSRIAALRQFGWLCGLGEILTAIAILLVTPAMGAWLERGAVPPATTGGWPRLWRRAVESRAAPWIVAAASVIPVAVLLAMGWPKLAPAVVAVRSERMEPIRIQNEVFELFGGGRGQWVVMVDDVDAEVARTRADAIADKLAASKADVASVSSLAELAPSRTTQTLRLRQRDLLGLPGKVDELRAALQRAGFATDRFEAAFDAWRHPSMQTRDLLDATGPVSALLRTRFVASEHGRTIVSLYVVPRLGRERQVESAVSELDPQATVTGYSRLDQSLRSSLAHDLPWIGIVALGLVAVAMAGALRGVREAMVVAATLAFEFVWIIALVRLFGVKIHAYNALVLPVLVGVTIDEAMFLLHRAGKVGVGGAVEKEARNVSTTALTTAAGFAALMFCQFEGLADLGQLGTLGVITGLGAALLVVPVGLRLRLDTGH
jgi:predicted RND superfamily exporter protein